MIDNSLLDYAKDVVGLVSYLKERLQQRFQNTELPFEYRWDCFMEFYNLGGRTESYCWDGWDNLQIFNGRGISWYDDFGIERHQTMDLVGRGLETICELVWDSLPEEIVTNYEYEEILPTNPIVVAAKESLMKDAITHMINDW